MIRLLDFFFSLVGILVLSPLFILLWLIGLFDVGSPLFKQKRVGRYQKSFILIKFRTMPLNTKSVATHLVKNLNLSYFCLFLRKAKLDEIPQLWNVLLGDMSLVGPRPCLFNQKKLIIERKKKGVFKVRPGITGLAQIRGINMKNPTLLAKTDLQMIKQMNLYYYFYYIFNTLIAVFIIK
jgi:lipopolysaccharide/colanic/teichoic acid biosynthesis glycosyltransferase